MKKTNILLFLFTAMLSLTAFYPNGPAKNGQGDRTGSPSSNGTCASSGCHTGTSNFNTSSAISIVNSQGQAVTSYQSDSTYKITMTVNATGAKQYGFQMIPLNSAKASVGQFMGLPSNAQIIAFSGKFVVEQKAPSTPNNWTFNWKAPKGEVGPITFYACGLATNQNGKESGDQAATTSFTLEKTTATEENKAQSADWAIKQVSSEYVNISFGENASNANYIATILSVDGVALKAEKIKINANENEKQLNINTLNAGLYFINITDGHFNKSLKFIKR